MNTKNTINRTENVFKMLEAFLKSKINEEE